MTKHQISLLHYASHGWNNAKIGEKLELSERTIKNHFSKLYDQMKVENRTQAVAMALREGIIE